IGGKTVTDLSGTTPAINNGGTVAFAAGFAGGTGIFTPTQLLVKSGDTIGGQTLTTDFNKPAINDGGAVVFKAGIPGGEGIFTQSDLVAKTGDIINGKTLNGVGAGPASPWCSWEGSRMAL